MPRRLSRNSHHPAPLGPPRPCSAAIRRSWTRLAALAPLGLLLLLAGAPRSARAVQDEAAEAVTREDFTSPEVREKYLSMKHAGIAALVDELEKIEAIDFRYVTGKALLHDLVRNRAGYENYEQDTARSLALVYQECKRLDLRHYALRLFGELGTRKTLQYLRYRFFEKDFAPDAIEALRISPNARAGDLLLFGLENDRFDYTELYIRALGTRRFVPAIPKLIPYLDDENEQLVLAATAALGCMPDLAALDALIPRAQDSSTELGLAAMYAVRNVCRYLQRAGHEEVALDGYRRIQASIPTKDGQNVAIGGFAELGGLSELELIGKVIGELDPSLHVAFVTAAVNIGARLDHHEHQETLRKAYEECLEVSPPGQIITVRLTSRLRALGVGDPLEEVDGTFRRWWVFGSYPCESIADWALPHLPERQVDLLARDPLEKKTLEWTLLTNDEPDGRVQLDRLVQPNNSAVAYAYLVFEVAEGQGAELRTGSDDGLVVWLNGKKVFEYLQPRAYRPEEDRIPVVLTAGKNRLLMKVCEDDGTWFFAARLLDREGKPIPFKIL